MSRDSMLVAIILAGGSGTRMGHVGRLLPKALLPIRSDATLLTRLIEQLAEVGISRIIVSTTPIQFDLLSEFVKDYSHMRELAPGSPPVSITVQENDAHSVGPVPALAAAIRAHPASSYILCLSDIFYYECTFHSLVRAAIRGENAMLVGEYADGRGGVVFSKSGVALRLSYQWVRGSTNSSIYNWTGAAAFGHETLGDLDRFSTEAADVPLEDLFQYLIDARHRFGVLVGGSFINVNDFASYLACQRALHTMEGDDLTARRS